MAEPTQSLITDYLKSHGAIGRDKAIKASIIASDLNIPIRRLTEMVGTERGNGSCICASTCGNRGYFLPKSGEDIVRQFKTLENGFKRRARAIRPFREYMKVHKKAARETWEEEEKEN